MYKARNIIFMYIKFKNRQNSVKLIVANFGGGVVVGFRIPQSVASWHNEYFKLQEFEKSQNRKVILTSPSSLPLLL